MASADVAGFTLSQFKSTTFLFATRDRDTQRHTLVTHGAAVGGGTTLRRVVFARGTHRLRDECAVHRETPFGIKRKRLFNFSGGATKANLRADLCYFKLDVLTAPSSGRNLLFLKRRLWVTASASSSLPEGQQYERENKRIVAHRVHLSFCRMN